MSDQKDGMDAGVPQQAELDGDASSESVNAGIVPSGNEALPASNDSPPIDGGIVGDTSTDSTAGATGATEVNDKQGEVPPEEMNR